MLNIPEGKTGAVYSLYRTHFTPRKNLANGNGVLHFYKIIGKAEIWLDGVLMGKKDTFAPAELNVIIQGEVDKKAGVEGAVVIEAKK